MYKIKQLSEDFIVKEINDIELDESGEYSYFLLKKRNYNTLRAIEAISNKLNINIKNIGFAGSKDKNAITEQVISIYNGNENIENIQIKDIELKYLGKGNEKIFLGSLKGNKFTITIRNLDNKKINNNEVLIPNYFGPQRFSTSNHLIGKAIVKKDFEEAIKVILSTNSDYNGRIKQHLEKKINDFVVALKIIPLKLLKLYVHAYQSFIFNKVLEQYTKTNKKIEKIPIVGFGTESNDKIMRTLLEKEKIVPRDFIIRQIPELSSEGDERSAFMAVKDFKIIKQEKDELNEGKEKLIVEFTLPKGSYATVFIDYLFRI
jgi:tRNA pseudouridine13 synthase